MKPAVRVHGRRGTLLQVFVAACSGSAKLSEEIGLPLIHVGASLDAAASIRRLNEREHGSGVRVPNIFQPLGFDRGWSDWEMIPYDPGPWPSRSMPRPEGVRVVAERIIASLPLATPPSEFCAQLRAALRHLRLQEVTTGMPYMEARSAALAEYVVHPRYTGNAIDGDFRGATIVEDLYVLDPAEAPWTLFWASVAARLAAIEGRPS